MNIFLNENFIRIDCDNLSGAQKNQLKYYGFVTKSKNEYLFSGIELKETVLKVVDYFSHEGINLELPLNIEMLISERNAKKTFFEDLKKRAEEYKDGYYDNAEFQNFSSFINNKISRKLKSHQTKAAYHHYILKNAANFSVPGSGKTSTILTVYEKLRMENVVNKLFVVGPPSSFTAWETEFVETLGRMPKFKVLAGGGKNSRIENYFDFFDNTELFLTSFQSFSNDYEYIIGFFAHSTNDICFVIDEAHYIKQIDGKWATAVLNTSKFAKVKYVLTGTPCPKSYTDLFNLFDLLWGENTAITDSEKAKIQALEKAQDYVRAGTLVHDKFDSLFYRVRKKDLGLTEPLFHDPILIDMNTHERNIYDAIYKRISELSYFDGTKNFMTLLNLKRGRIIRLRQLTSYAKLLSTVIDDYNEDLVEDHKDLSNIIVNYDKFETPAKLQYLLQLILRIQEKDPKVLVWSNFIETINVIESHLVKGNLKCAHIYGSTPIIDTSNKDLLTREKIINEFLTPNSSIDILIANPGACAESISLHKGCHHAIYYDLSYNCAQYLQSLDRIHRVGGSENIISEYYFLQYRNTIDLDILNNLLVKRDKMYNVIESDSDIYNLDIGVFYDMNEDENAYDRIFKK